jgi:hypothetical protein
MKEIIESILKGADVRSVISEANKVLDYKEMKKKYKKAKFDTLNHRNKDIDYAQFSNQADAMLMSNMESMSMFQMGDNYIVPLNKAYASWLVVDSDQLAKQFGTFKKLN